MVAKWADKPKKKSVKNKKSRITAIIDTMLWLRVYTAIQKKNDGLQADEKAFSFSQAIIEGLNLFLEKELKEWVGLKENT